MDRLGQGQVPLFLKATRFCIIIDKDAGRADDENWKGDEEDES